MIEKMGEMRLNDLVCLLDHFLAARRKPGKLVVDAITIRRVVQRISFLYGPCMFAFR